MTDGLPEPPEIDGRDVLPADKEAQEDRVIAALIAHLGNCGWTASIVERPDRVLESERAFPRVTSDALIRTRPSGLLRRFCLAWRTWWAVDVMSLADNAQQHIALLGLHDRLGPLAERHGVSISLEGSTPAPADLRSIERTLDRAISSTPDQGRIDAAGVSASWRRPTTSERAQLTVMNLLMPETSPLLSDQVLHSIRDPLIKKATNQARRARESGCRTAVVLDWVGHRSIAQGTHWLPRHPSTIATAVGQVLSGVEHSLDAVLLLDRGGQWHVMYGDFPSFDESSEQRPT